jgi:MFS superfamily sulfate permease-like transporter
LSLNHNEKVGIAMAGQLLKYQRDWFRFDTVAGLTTAAVVIPKSMAFASIAGLPVQAGLYVALVPMFVYALLGTSRPLSVSSTSTLAILTATELAIVVPGGDPDQLMAAASTLALLVGGILILAGILRLGFLANFISDPILTGFKAGIGLVIVVDQVPKLLGVHIERGNFFHNVFSPWGMCRRLTARHSSWPQRCLRFCSAWSGSFQRPPLPLWLWSWVWRRPDFLG